MTDKRPTTSTVCSWCSSDFTHSLREKNRQIRKGRNHFFCSRACSCSFGNIHFTQKRRDTCLKNLPKTKKGDRITELSPFKYYIRKAKARKTKSVSVSDRDLLAVWQKQKGRCAYSGIELVLNEKGSVQDMRFLASLDRINSDRGYEADNVQFISASLNFAKNTLTDTQFREFMDLIRLSTSAS